MVAAPGTLARRHFAAARQACRNDDPHAVDEFYLATSYSWQALHGDPASGMSPAEACELYHDSLAALLETAEEFGRYDGQGALHVEVAGAAQTIPIVCQGLPWQAREISEVQLIKPRLSNKLTNYYSWDGFGLPVVCIRCKGEYGRKSEPYLPPRVPFAATVVLRPGACAAEPAVLEFFNPLSVATTNVQGAPVTLAGDISAPLETRLQISDLAAILGFLDPGKAERGDGLRFLEPYQPGKIPVIFVHGLLSDPTTWFDMANDLRTQAWFNERYQIWGFSYATGRAFVTAASIMRTENREALTRIDPASSDPALRQVVLVGHSMGGLVSKLQVTYSDQSIWRSFAKVPVEQVVAPERVRFELAERCFFDPQPFVTRVVFIATPHDGSGFAARGVGRLSSALVELAPADRSLHDELVACNPGVFSEKFERRVPTSVDLLEPEDPTLQAIRTLKYACRIPLHSIIGTGHPSITGPSDGVVPVSSAQCPGVVSDRFVDATHTSILHHPDTQVELRRILWLHLEQCGR